MTSQALIELVPETASGEIVAGGTSGPIVATGTGPAGTGPAGTGAAGTGAAGIGATGTEATAATETRVVAWRRPASPIPLRRRIAGWRARHWRRLVLGWFVLSLAIVALAAEPRTDFPRAQAGTVPAVRTVLQVASGLTVAGVPFVLIVLP